MEYLASADRPLLVDTFEVTEDNYERWAEALERGVAAMGGQVLGAVPRTSAFEWQWAWGPPPQGRVRVQAGGRTVVVSPEATVLIRPPEGRERGFAQRYFERIRKAQPLAAAKQAVQERLAARLAAGATSRDGGP
ncbi:MAG: hypothetical protein RML45_05120 [Acetobacteraceae bacterium]|nr:hypothetical protein [Acetobacteraceae bacterium]